MRLRRVTRSPAVFWAAATALAVLTGTVVSHLVGSAAAEAARYGSLRPALVDILATFAQEAAGSGDPTFEMARGAPVLAVGEETVTVALSPEEAKRVAFAGAGGAITITVSSWAPGEQAPGNGL